MQTRFAIASGGVAALSLVVTLLGALAQQTRTGATRPADTTALTAALSRAGDEAKMPIVVEIPERSTPLPAGADTAKDSVGVVCKALALERVPHDGVLVDFLQGVVLAYAEAP